MPVPRGRATAALAAALITASCAGGEQVHGRQYPWHTGIVATTFWVGEVLDPDTSDGSQVISTYDSAWQQHYGGCDGVLLDGRCDTEPRTAANGYFPTRMTPRENPFYLDLPFDDLNDPIAFEQRGAVVPWSRDPGYAGRERDESFSYLKNRWVQLTRGDAVCFGQVQDAGPAEYHDARYVFGHDDPRPVNTRFNGAGLDVSPALNGCLGFTHLNGAHDRVDWRFVEESDVPDGPWRRVVTTSPPTLY
ncbi:hypothetical protein GCM10027271_48140 [Saccharopolyspora gloriosae]|uniref:Uncharacterized protein n=1 Tax=Saccharopolyspora gloriosae TaxID=455344 RepID=A0A840N7U5_9PSEU|nr:hypothetical protein [Saccharopolyspora gloriosae]MBB5068196.1 hypothetical protein [Saccharopolyspora gloriosae]